MKTTEAQRHGGLQAKDGSEPDGPAGELGLMARGVELPTTATGEFLYMPAGEHQVHVKNREYPVTVLVDAVAAERLNEQLKALQARSGHRAYFDFNHEDQEASFWPQEFVWRPDGVHVRGEWSAKGKEAVEGKTFRSFSPVFHLDNESAGRAGQPTRIRCNPNARLNMGGLVNAPAFHEMAAFFARANEDLAGEASSALVNQKQKDNEMEKTIEGLQASIKSLEDQVKELQGASRTGQDDKTIDFRLAQAEAELKAERAELAAKQFEARAAGLEAKEKARVDKAADAAVKAACTRGAIPPQNTELQAKWRSAYLNDPDGTEVMLAALPGNAVLGQNHMTQAATALAASQGRGLQPTPGVVMGREDATRVLQGYRELMAKQHTIQGFDDTARSRRQELAMEAAWYYRREIQPRPEILDVPLKAADTSANLGTLSGTLVLQRTLELFRYEFPILSNIYTDFSDSPAMFKQTEATRVITVPSVQEYDETVGSDGRPAGWSTAVSGTTTDVNISLDKFIGIPLVFGAQTLASTVRRLFDEFAPAQMYSLSKYMVDKVYALFTAANYGSYKTKGTKVPTPYATFPMALAECTRGKLCDLTAAFNTNEVPLANRCLLLNSQYYAKLANDPSLVIFFSTQGASALVSENQLPKLATFRPIEAPNLPTTGGMVGMALHKAGAVIKARLPNDYTQVFGAGASYGNITVVTAPDIGLSLMLVQFTNHVGGYAEQNIMVMLGAGKGDARGGLVITGA